MSEEVENNDGTWSGLKKTVIGTLTTLITGGGTWLGVYLFNNGSSTSDEEAVKTEQVTPAAQPVQAPAPVIVNVQQSQENTQQQKSGGTTTIIKERVVEKAVEKKEEKKSESQDAPW